MTVDTILEELRAPQTREETLKKHMGNYRSREVDQYIEKLRERLRMMEAVYQERLEEMRVNLLGVTRERDAQTARIGELETRLNDTPEICRQYLMEQDLVAVPKEKYSQWESVDLTEYEQNRIYKGKCISLEQTNRELQAELVKVRTAQKEAREAADRMQKLAMQAEMQTELIEQQKVQLQMQTELVAQKQGQLENMDSISKSQAAQLAQVHSKYHTMEMEHRRLQEINQLLGREKECLEKDLERQKELWEAERQFFINRMSRTLNSQKQYMQHLKESIAASISQMEKESATDFMDMTEN